MDWETSADAWYVWLGVSIISLAMAGFVLGLPTGPPPDADQAANTIERTSGSTYQAASTVQHDADEIKVDGKTIELRNEHGTDRSSIRYGEVVAVNGEDRLEDLVYGEDFESVYGDELEDPHDEATAAFIDDVTEAEENNSGEWLTASDELTVRQVQVEPDEPIRLRARGNMEYATWTTERTFLPEKVVIDYEGFDEYTSVRYTIEGDPILSDLDESDLQAEADTDHGFTALFHHQSGTKNIDLSRYSEDRYWGGGFPLEITASFDGHTCEGVIEGVTQAVDLCSVPSDTNDRANELDWIELNDETGEYHVTLVVV